MRTRVIVSEFAPGTGWDPVTVMARLLARCLGAELVSVPSALASRRRYPVLARTPRLRGPNITLVVAPQPAHLYALLDMVHWVPGNGVTAGWVVDSFLTDRIPAVARHGGHFDHLFIADGELVGEWRAATGVPTSWLPWGSDVLRRGSGQEHRPIDLQRIGRQPDEWDDDAAVGARLAAQGLRYGPRPPFADDAEGNQAQVMAAMASAKLTLSFTNRVSPASYTHASREYLTARWADAVASGARVAGVAPRCAATERLLWPEAIVDLGGTGMDEGLTHIREALAAWTPQTPAAIHRRALGQVDWRWRFAELVETLHLEAPVLEAEIAEIRAAQCGSTPA